MKKKKNAPAENLSIRLPKINKPIDGKMMKVQSAGLRVLKKTAAVFSSLKNREMRKEKCGRQLDEF